MIVETVHLPRLYRELPDGIAASARCCQLIRVLREMERNCVLLVDAGNTMSREMSAAMHQWPFKYRVLGTELWASLRERIVRLPVDDAEGVSDCETPGCGSARAIARSRQPAIIFGPSGCEVCFRSAGGECEYSDPAEYELTHFVRARHRAESLTLADGDWDKEQFEREVWTPLFRHAKHLKLFDRQIGRHLQRSDGGNQFQVGYNYARSLKWIAELFATLTQGRAARHFEITCGLRSHRHSPEEMHAAAEILHSFGRELSVECGLEVQMHVRQESYEAELPHDRALMTNQIALQFGRGFDLLRADGRVRDVTISCLSEPGKYECSVRRLDEIR